ncbi:MAG: glycosyltransferase [Candidatus Micrarchaeia archaeon]
MKYDKITVVLPTLNEKDTIGILIADILKTYPGIKIIVVDDNSSDGTIQIVKHISAHDRSVRVFERRGNKGLTASVIDGIKLSKTDYVIVMDADMQHPYEKIKEIKKKFEEGYDIVIATRTSVKNWQLYRKIISKLLMFFGYMVLLAKGNALSKDIFSGYFGIERKLFIKIYYANEKRFVGPGYKVLFDFLKCTKKDEKIAEVPYVFGTRRHGSSKAGIKQGIFLFKSFFS